MKNKVLSKLLLTVLSILMTILFSFRSNYSVKDLSEEQLSASDDEKQVFEEDITTLSSFNLQLVDARSGKGIRDICVLLTYEKGITPFSTTTDIDGNVTFKDLPTGEYTLYATGANYNDLTATIFFYDNSITNVEGITSIKRRIESARISMLPLDKSNRIVEQDIKYNKNIG